MTPTNDLRIFPKTHLSKEEKEQAAREMQPLPNQPPPPPRILNPHARPEPPPGPNEIELHPGDIANAPRRVLADKACTALAAVHAKEKEFSARMAKEQAALAAERQAAVEIQNHWQELLITRAGLREDIQKATAKIAEHRARLQAIPGEVLQTFRLGISCADHCTESGRREFELSFLEKWLAEWSEEIKQVEADIKSYAAQHGLK